MPSDLLAFPHLWRFIGNNPEALESEEYVRELLLVWELEGARIRDYLVHGAKLIE